MANDQTKPKSSALKSEKRRPELRRTLPRQTIDLWALLQRREVVNTLVLSFLFMVAVGVVIAWSHREPRAFVGQIATDTRLKRVDFDVLDEARTQRARESARERAPRVYQLNTDYLDGLETALLGLPVALEGRTAFEEISERLRREFNLTPELLIALQPYAREGRATDEWREWVTRLTRETLIQRPIIESESWQVEMTRNIMPEFRTTTGAYTLRDFNVIELQEQTGELNRDQLMQVAERARFPREIAPVVAARIAHNAEPVFQFDLAAMRQLQDQSAARVPETRLSHRAGEAIFRRGDVLTASQVELAFIEEDEFRAGAGLRGRMLEFAGVFGLSFLIAGFLAGYFLTFYARIVRNAWRMIAIYGLMLLMLVATIAFTARMPQLLIFATVATTTFFSLVMVVAYDRRLSLMLTGLLAAIMSFALEQSPAFYLFLMITAATAAARMAEVRHRNSLIRATSVAAIVAGVAALCYGLFDIPHVDQVWGVLIGNAAWAAAASLAVGFFLLGLLPTIERVFDITTGMTLVELRDPKNTLLRQLQERAPGTYNHSLQVASIAEAATDAIGANGLLVYVGALYHDIGKMNKPDYFVENQSGGPSKHEKLSPAMSLLVIVGHVKDGMEMAREYGLPRVLHHFIESHHGTTLVEYFYHSARSRAEETGDRVTDIEYRYPGPKPRTKEAAILMLADASESATRAMDEPTPASIENLVRKLARKRLADGQFDDCELTFRELRQIEDSIIKSVWALHHGRISYPTDEPESLDADHHPGLTASV